MEKNRILNHSITQSASLFDVPGTEACASEQDLTWQDLCCQRKTYNNHNSYNVEYL